MISAPFHFRTRRPRSRAFTLIELLAVIGIIILLVGITIPAIKSLSKSNDQSQSVNLVRSMISTARAIAISQHRPVGVVFFEESPTYSLPVNSNRTAMQLFIEDYNQVSVVAGTRYVYYSTAREYLPAGVKLASLSDAGSFVEAGDPTSTSPARAILFDANGQLLLRGGLCSWLTNGGTAGQYPKAYGDWNFIGYSTGNLPNGQPGNSYSSPGFFLFSKAEYDAQPAASKAAWLKKNASVIIVNSNTGGVLR
jgi:type II secretory pathway pseudopilin PulG